MQKMIRVGVIVILFIGCSVQPENKSIDNSNASKIEAKKLEARQIKIKKIEIKKNEARKLERNINDNFNKKIKKLSTSKTSIILVASAISAKIAKKPLIRNHYKKVVIDRNNNLMWQDNKNMAKKNWDGAKNHCNNLQFASFRDWRLPEINELLSITDDTRYNPAINKSFKNYHSAYFWSSSSSVPYLENAWLVDFRYGNSDYGNVKSNLDYVRCVRDNLI